MINHNDEKSRINFVLKFSRVLKMSRTGILILLLAMFAFVSFGEPETPDPTKSSPAPANVETDHVVFVPYEKIDGPKWDEGQSVLIPYAEFLKLKQAAVKPDQPEYPPRAAIVKTDFTGSVVGNTAIMEGTLIIDVIASEDDRLNIPLHFRNVAIESAQIEKSGEGILAPLKDGSGLEIIVKGEGRRVINIKMAGPLQTKGAAKTFELTLPSAAASSLSLSVPEDVKLDYNNSSPSVVTPMSGKGIKVNTSGGTSGRIHLTWLPKVEAKDAAASNRFKVEETITTTVSEKSVSAKVTIKCDILSGALDKLPLILPADVRLLSVSGSFVKDWTTPDADGRMNVELLRPVEDTFVVNLDIQMNDTSNETISIPELNVPGAVRESGVIIVTPESGLAVWSEKSEGLESHSIANSAGAARAYRFAQPGWDLTISRKAIPSRMRAEGTILYEVTEEITSLKTRHDINISGRGVFEIMFEAPAGYELRDAGPDELVAGFRQQGKRVELNLRNEQLAHMTIDLRFQRPRSSNENSVTLEPVSVVGAEEDFGNVVLAAPVALRIIEMRSKGLTAADVRTLQNRLQPLISSNLIPVLGYSYFTPVFDAEAEIERQKTRLIANTSTMVDIQPALMRIDSTINYTVEFSATDTFRLLLPAEVGDDVRFIGPDIKEKVRSAGTTGDGLTTWTIRLQRRILGPVALRVIFERPLPDTASGKPVKVTIPHVQAADVIRETGHVAISRGENLEVRVAEAEALETRDVKELPPSLASAFLGFRYFDPSAIRLEMELIRREPEKVLGALIRRMHIESVLSDQREVVHEVYMEVQNNREQYLELLLPVRTPKVEIWSAFVRGVPVRVTTKQDQGNLVHLIELTKSEGMDKAFRVRLIIRETLPGGNLGRSGKLTFEPPLPLNIPVQRATWKLFLPKENLYIDFGGEMRLAEGGRSPWIEPAAENLLNDLPAELAGGIAAPTLQPKVANVNTNYNTSETEDEKRARLQSSALEIDIVKEGAQFVFSKLSGVGIVEITYWNRKSLIILQGAIALILFIALVILMWRGRMLGAGAAACVAFFIGVSLLDGLAGRVMSTSFAAAGAALALALLWRMMIAVKANAANRPPAPSVPTPPPPIPTIKPDDLVQEDLPPDKPDESKNDQNPLDKL